MTEPEAKFYNHIIQLMWSIAESKNFNKHTKKGVEIPTTTLSKEELAEAHNHLNKIFKLLDGKIIYCSYPLD